MAWRRWRWTTGGGGGDAVRSVSVCMGPDGRVVVASSGNTDCTVRLWDLWSPPPLKLLRLCWPSRAPAQPLDAHGLVFTGSTGLQPQQLAAQGAPWA
jgi:hypothetical protein